jgi:hypothetical protein
MFWIDPWYWTELTWWLFWVAMAVLVWFIVDRVNMRRGKGNTQ